MVNFYEPRTRFPDSAFTDGQWKEGHERGWQTGVEHGKDQGFGRGVLIGVLFGFGLALAATGVAVAGQRDRRRQDVPG